VVIDHEPIVIWVLPVGNNGGVFLEAQGEGFQEIYELHSGPLAKYPKVYPQLLYTPKAKIWANSRNCPTAMPTHKGVTAAGVLLKAYGGGSKKVSFTQTDTPSSKPHFWVTYAAMDCGHRQKQTHRQLSIDLTSSFTIIC